MQKKKDETEGKKGKKKQKTKRMAAGPASGLCTVCMVLVRILPQSGVQSGMTSPTKLENFDNESLMKSMTS